MKKYFTLLTALLLVLTAFNLFSQHLTTADIYASPKFFPKMIRGLNSLNDGEHYTVLENDSINVYGYQSGELAWTVATQAVLVPAGA